MGPQPFTVSEGQIITALSFHFLTCKIELTSALPISMDFCSPSDGLMYGKALQSANSSTSLNPQPLTWTHLWNQICFLIQSSLSIRKVTWHNYYTYGILCNTLLLKRLNRSIKWNFKRLEWIPKSILVCKNLVQMPSFASWREWIIIFFYRFSKHQ